MKFLDALEEIKAVYPIYQRVTDVAEIQVMKLLTLSDFYYIALVDNKGSAILTDIGVVSDLFDTVEEEEWRDICAKHHVAWEDWHIFCKYEGIQSLENFIALLDDVSESMEGR